MGTVNDWTIGLFSKFVVLCEITFSDFFLDEERSMLRYIKNYGLRWADLAAELQTKKGILHTEFIIQS
jgi:hypothetical protein